MDEVKLEGRLTAVEKLAGSNRHRLEDVERRQDDLDKLVQSVALLANEQEHIRDDVKEIKADVKSLTEKPAKRWEALVEKVLLVIAGAFAAWVISGAPGM